MNSLLNYNRIEVKFAKCVFEAVAIPIGGILLWLFLYSSKPINDFQLITGCSTTDGQITKASEEVADVEVADNGRTSERDYYDYNYTFKLPNGKIITSRGFEPGEVPVHFTDLNFPIRVQVEYIADNPSISRIKGMESNITTIMEWIRYRIGLHAVIFLLLCLYSYKALSVGLSEYKGGKAWAIKYEKMESLD